MRSNNLFLALATVLLASIGFCPDSPADTKEPKPGSAASNREDQADVALTLYDSNLALVKERRRIKLRKGVAGVTFMHVASQVIDASMHVRSLVDPESFKVLEQNYEYDSPNDIPVKKELMYEDAKYYYTGRYEEILSNQKMGVFAEIRNTKENNLGIPLPKGTARIYRHDREGSFQFVNEDSINHMPKDEKARMKLDEAFDVVGSRKQTEWRKIAYDTYETAFETSLRNHKQEDVVAKVMEPIPGDWIMINSSHNYKRSEVFTEEFNIPVPKDHGVKLTYRGVCGTRGQEPMDGVGGRKNEQKTGKNEKKRLLSRATYCI